MFKTIAAGIALSFTLMGAALAQTCPAYNFTLTNGANANADQVMNNFNTVRTCVNTIGALRGHIAGLTLNTTAASATFGVAPGQATDSTAARSMVLPAAYAKSTAAWSAGSGVGSLDTGSIANNTWYHVFLIGRTDTGAADVMISLSPTSPALQGGYTLFRRIGSMKTNGSGQWVFFQQNGDQFLWYTPIVDYNSQAIGTSANALVLSAPSGISTEVLFNWSYFDQAGAATYLYFSSFWQASVAADINHLQGQYNSALLNLITGQLLTRTDTASQIRVIASTNTNARLFVSTQGWIDTRGKNN